MKPALLSLMLALCTFATGCATAQPAEPVAPTLIAFGACAHEGKPQPIWDAVVAAEPELFIFTGDNIYGDTNDMAVMQAKYDKLAAKPGYQKLLKTTPVLAVYDDHDLGKNDGGKDYPRRKESAQMCLDFFGVPADSPRRTREGIYGSQMLGKPGSQVQVILLDTRYFRDKLDRSTLTKEEKNAKNVVGIYQPTKDTTRTMLGEDQWNWLEKQLKKEADVRLIVSSIQVISWEKGMETWGNMPHERDRLFKLIETTEANGVVFLSGDVHFTELSKSDEGPYPMYDLTSSGLNQKPRELWYTAPNSYRVKDKLYTNNNFGLVRVDWAGDDTTITLSARNVKGETAHETVIPLSTLQ
ncbi:MAG: alkaline phosphatase D family protein [Phycisphaeraceae bacterium]